MTYINEMYILTMNVKRDIHEKRWRKSERVRKKKQIQFQKRQPVETGK